MAETKRTEIAQLGEFGLIDHLTKDLKPQNKSTLYGVGDDCAVLDYSAKDKEVLVTTDRLNSSIISTMIMLSMPKKLINL